MGYYLIFVFNFILIYKYPGNKVFFYYFFPRFNFKPIINPFY